MTEKTHRRTHRACWHAEADGHLIEGKYTNYESAVAQVRLLLKMGRVAWMENAEHEKVELPDE